MLEKVSKQHQDWLNIAKSFLSKEDAEDIVQELYITLHKYNIKENKIRYKDEINRGFIYIVLTNLINAFKRSRNRQKRDVRLNRNIEDAKELQQGSFITVEVNDDTLEHLYHNIPYLIGSQEDYDDIFERIQDEVDTWPHYDKSLFELYMYSGLSLRELSKGSKKNLDKFININFKLNPESIKRGTGISVTSMFHTLKSCKEKIKLKLNYEL